MWDRNRSGQAVFFPLVSAISGNPVTGQATGISGRVTLDGGAQAVVAGAIDEPGGGQYRFLPFAADTNGNCIGLYFTASGCAPVNFTITTQQNTSGRIFTGSGLTYIASGPNVVVPPATISGVFGTIPIATISGTNAFIPSGTLQIASGPFVQTTVTSGSIYLASGSIFTNTFASGVVTVDFPYGMLKADQSGITGEAQRSLLNAARKLNNKWDTTALSGFLTVYKENDSTAAYTQAVTAVLASSGAPIIGLDTA